MKDCNSIVQGVGCC